MEAGLDAVQTGEGAGVGDAPVLAIGKHAWSLGPAGPILRAAGLGFALGLLVMTAVALFVR